MARRFVWRQAGLFTPLCSFCRNQRRSDTVYPLLQWSDAISTGTAFRGGAFRQRFGISDYAEWFADRELISLNITNGNCALRGADASAGWQSLPAPRIKAVASGAGDGVRLTTNGTLTTIYSFSGGG